jgi:hypothetical protein
MEKLLSRKHMKHLTFTNPIMQGQVLGFHLPSRKDTMEASIAWKMVVIFFSLLIFQAIS